MGTAYDAQDAIGLYRTIGLNSTGGVMTPREIVSIDWDFNEESVIPGLMVPHVSGACGTGTGQIRANSSGQLLFTAPGSTEGTAVTVAQGATATLVDGTTPSKYVRVYRETSETLGGIFYLLCEKQHNNIIGHDNLTNAERVAGHDSYRGFILLNRSASTATNVRVYIETTSGVTMRVAYETPDATGAIQTVASETTAPSGVSWSTATTSGAAISTTLAADGMVGLWTHRQTAAGVAAGAYEIRLKLEYTVSAVTYTQTLYGRYLVEGVALFELFAGVDAAPDFTAAAATTSATSPFTYALSAPGAGVREHRLAVRYLDVYGRRSVNQDTTSKFIDSTGAEVVSSLLAPTGVNITSVGNGDVRVQARYIYGIDDPVADYFRLYYTVTGSDPVVGVTSPVDVAMANNTPWYSAGRILDTTIAGIGYGTDFKVIVRAFRDSDNAESNNTTVHTHTVTTYDPRPIAWPRAHLGRAYGIISGTVAPDFYYYIAGTSDGAYFRYLDNETNFVIDGQTVWRVVSDSLYSGGARMYIPNGWSIQNVSSANASSGAAIDVISYTAGDKRISLNMNGFRLLVIDKSNLTITLFGDYTVPTASTITAHPSPPDGIWFTSTFLRLHVYDSASQSWKAYAELTTTGFTTTTPIDQMRA